MELHLRIIGIILAILAAAHIRFPAYFKWKDECGSLSLINRQMMYIHTLFIAVSVLLMSVLCLSSAPELVHTPLGKRISLGLGIFWLLRLVIQFFGYSKELWAGKRFETIIHVVFSLLWIYITAVFMLTGIGPLS